ncbi:MAG: hypothetical protein IJ373_06300, partial [Clostridia bacterium]|nr:hypothetical protein [Clostridia bacterium]
NLVETFRQEHANNGSSSGSTTNRSNSERTEEVTNDLIRKLSNTPQGRIENLDDHLTEATVENGNQNGSTKDVGSSEGSATQTSNDSGTIEHTLTKRGNIGVQPLGGEVENIRKAFVNIDQMVIDDLKDLFVQIY